MFRFMLEGLIRILIAIIDLSARTWFNDARARSRRGWILAISPFSLDVMTSGNVCSAAADRSGRVQEMRQIFCEPLFVELKNGQSKEMATEAFFVTYSLCARYWLSRRRVGQIVAIICMHYCYC